jgi:uracil-DNA glycosylase family 4
LLRALLDDAGLAETQVFLTNAVKHFRYELRGKRRLHKTPLQRHVAACHVWLEAEIRRARPAAIVTLGATALGAVLGRKLSITAAREERVLHEPSGIAVVATVHPSAILRAPDAAGRDALRSQLLADLRRAARLAGRDRER